MAWQESDRVSQRLEFVNLARLEGSNISLLCRRFGVSRKTGYKWLKRWNDEGSAGLVDQSRPSRVSYRLPVNTVENSPIAPSAVLVERTFYCRGETGQQLLLGAYSVSYTHLTLPTKA